MNFVQKLQYECYVRQVKLNRGETPKPKKKVYVDLHDLTNMRNVFDQEYSYVQTNFVADHNYLQIVTHEVTLYLRAMSFRMCQIKVLKLKQSKICTVCNRKVFSL